MAEEERKRTDDISDLPELPIDDSLDEIQGENPTKANNSAASQQKPVRVKVYPQNAKGPFEVFFRRLDKPLNALHISDLLHRSYRSVKEVKSISLSKVRATFSNLDDANAVVADDSLTASYRVYVPCEQVEITGVVYDEVLDLETVVQVGFGQFKNASLPKVQVLECERLAVKSAKGDSVELTSSNAIRVTFAGTVLPNYLNVNRLLLPVRYFTPKVMQCTRCQSFGHTSKFCVNKFRCAKCGLFHESATCSAKPEKCVHCEQQHSSPKECPRFLERKEVLRRQMINRSKQSYAELVKSLGNSFESVNEYQILNEANQDNSDQQAHCSYNPPVKRKKPIAVETARTNLSSTNSSKPTNDKSQKKTMDQNWPKLRKTQDIPGFQKIEDTENEDSSIRESLTKVMNFVCKAFSIDQRWIDLIELIIPSLTPIIKSLCDKLPLLKLFFNING